MHGVLCVIAPCAVLAACKGSPAPAPPAIGDAVETGSGGLELLAARGETLHLRGDLQLGSLSVARFALELVTVTRPSTTMYGGSRGAGRYPDVLRPGGHDYSELTIARDATPGTYTGTLGERAVTLTISPVTLPPPGPPRVWAYYDPRELGGANEAPSAAERACIAMFRARGVLLSPDIPFAAWPARRELVGDAPFIPVLIGDNFEITEWLEMTRGTGQTPFAIPVDEPHTADARAKARAFGELAPPGFLAAVTDEPHPDYGDAIDLYITLYAKRDDAFARWTYNGAPPRAGSVVVDTAAPPGLRTWGWIAHRWRIPLWYVWDALYWHDRHNHNKRGALDIARDATSFDNGDDHGNLDGVLALPGDATTPCLPTLRLAALDRGMQDRALIELASACDAAATDALVARMVPRALGDAPEHGAPSWPSDEAAWERARRELITIASRCVK